MELLNNNANPLRGIILGFLLVLILVEMIWSYFAERKVYEWKDSLANISIFIGFQLSKLFFYGVQLKFMEFIASFAPIKLPTTPVVFISSLIAVDFMYYWYHRYSHKLKFLWAFHLIHHSSMFMNLTVSYRLNWLNAIISPLILAPLVVMGFPIAYIIISFALNLVYQFFLHTEAIGKLGVLEKIVSTPSAHRVHHGSNAIYIDKNFGGILIIWDRLFGTYQPETIKPTYGITTGFISNNPFVLNFKGFVDFFKGKMNYKG